MDKVIGGMDLPNFSGGNCAIDTGGHCATFMMLPSLKKRALAGQRINIKDLKQLVRLTKEGKYMTSYKFP